MSTRRALLIVAALAAVSACGPSRADRRSTTEAPMTPEQLLETAGLAVPDAELAVREVESGGVPAVRRVVEFSGEPAVVDAWIVESFSGELESRAYKDDMLEFVEHLGAGVQKKGDRVASGVHDRGGYVVVVGQEARPMVHVGVSISDR